MATRILLLRHAESADPTVFHGAESDVELSARGRAQAEAVARFLATRRPDALVSSGMRRARLTAEPISRACGLTVQVEPLLHERRVGILCGKAWRDYDSVWRETVRRWSSGETGFAPEGAESLDDLQSRILPVWQRIVAEHADKTLVVVAHGVVCKVVLVSILPGWSVADWPRLGPIRNTAVNELVYDGAVWSAVTIDQLPQQVEGIGEASGSVTKRGGEPGA